MAEGDADDEWIWLERDVLGAWRSIGESLCLTSHSQIARFLLDSYRNKAEADIGSGCVQCGSPVAQLCDTCLKQQQQQQAQMHENQDQGKMTLPRLHTPYENLPVPSNFENDLQHERTKQKCLWTQQREQKQKKHCQKQKQWQQWKLENQQQEEQQQQQEQQQKQQQGQQQQQHQQQQQQQQSDHQKQTKALSIGLPTEHEEMLTTVYLKTEDRGGLPYSHNEVQTNNKKFDNLLCNNDDDDNDGSDTDLDVPIEFISNQRKTKILHFDGQSNFKRGLYPESPHGDDWESESHLVSHSESRLDDEISTNVSNCDKTELKCQKESLNVGNKKLEVDCGFLNAFGEGLITHASGSKRNESNHDSQKETLIVESEKQRFGSKSAQRTKKKLILSESKCFECSVCSKSFAREKYLKRHERIHAGVKSFVCHVCGRAFLLNGDLKTHMLLHSGKKSFSCQTCHKTFARASGLNRHKLIHTGQRPHVCSVCGAAFSQAGNLKQHMLTHTQERPYVCDVCRSSFSQSSTLKEHKLVHSGQKSHACDVCSKAYYTAAKLNYHRQTHNRERDITKPKTLFVCEKCGKCASSASNLKKHKLIHADSKYVCDVCNKAFNFACNLKTHRLIHSGEKQEACSMCAKRFYTARDLKRHVVVHTGQKNYGCDVCSKTFTQASNLKQHKVRVHRLVASSHDLI